MLQIKKHSGIYTLQVEQELPINLKAAWDFFSSPVNLSKITPQHMGFQITSELASQMYCGQIITYRVGILPWVSSSWVTEITHVEEEKYFVDEQRFGPYQMWHHEHIFTPTDAGVVMKDKVSYKLPLGILGDIAQILFIKKQLENIFQYRYSALQKIFL